MRIIELISSDERPGYGHVRRFSLGTEFNVIPIATEKLKKNLTSNEETL